MRPLLLLAVAALLAPLPAAAQPQAGNAYFRDAEAALQEKLAQRPITTRAKNVILFVGDGMSIPTVTAARIYAGQKLGRDGVSHRLAMERLPYAALSRTYAHDSQVADSAPTATAMTSGVKTINDVLGVGPDVRFGDCASSRAQELRSIFELAEMAGLATGVVTTTRVTHATPASTYAHAANRDWEADSDMPAAARTAGCSDIAAQLLRWPYGNGFEIVLGGGRQKFLPRTARDPEYPDQSGARADGRDLIAEWQRTGARYVWNRAAFDAVDVQRTERLLGLFEPSDMHYEADRARDRAGEPSLAEMTRKAIQMLAKHADGFILMVEGGRIDHAHHAGNAARALEDTVAFDAAIAAAVAATNPEETLVIVTADHSHTLTISGYPARNAPILGLVAGADGRPVRAQDRKPYTILGYANGPGARNGARRNLSAADTTDVDFKQQALVPLGGETHAGDDVAIFAAGPFAHLFQGVVDQHFIYHVIAHASGIPQRAGVK